MLKIKLLAILLATLFATQVFADTTASYNAQTGSLHIPRLTVVGDFSRHVYSVDMIDNGGLNFSVSGVEDSAEYYSRTLVGLNIAGGSQVTEAEALQLSARALWSDGTWSDVTSRATWIESSTAINSVENGRVEADSVASDRTASVKATYTSGGASAEDSHGVTVTNSFVGRAYFQLIDQNVPSGYWAPLLNTDRNGIFFDLGGISYGIQSDEIFYANTYPEFANAIANELARQGLSGLIDVSIGDPFYTFNDFGERVQGYTIVLEAVNMEFSNLGFTILYDLSGWFNVYARYSTEPDPGPSTSGARLTIRMLNSVSNVTGNNPIEGFASISFNVGVTNVVVDVTAIATNAALDFTTAYVAVASAINTQLVSQGITTVTATVAAASAAVFSIPAGGYNVGDLAGSYYPIVLTNTGPESLTGNYINTVPLGYDTDISNSFQSFPATF